MAQIRGCDSWRARQVIFSLSLSFSFSLCHSTPYRGCLTTTKYPYRGPSTPYMPSNYRAGQITKLLCLYSVLCNGLTGYTGRCCSHLIKLDPSAANLHAGPRSTTARLVYDSLPDEEKCPLVWRAADGSGLFFFFEIERREKYYSVVGEGEMRFVRAYSHLLSRVEYLLLCTEYCRVPGDESWGYKRSECAPTMELSRIRYLSLNWLFYFFGGLDLFVIFNFSAGIFFINCCFFLALRYSSEIQSQNVCKRN